MLAVIAGGATATEFLVGILLERNFDVVVIDQDHETIEHLCEVLPTRVLIIEGDACDLSTLTDAECADADLFVALTSHDETNLVACELAATSFDIPRFIASVTNPKNAKIFKKLGIEAVSITEQIARMIVV